MSILTSFHYKLPALNKRLLTEIDEFLTKPVQNPELAALLYFAFPGDIS